ncbi:frataxin homolog, mitochondrial [Athalia rosae]|uniref:frataxin homolog, mitochondrial n=1 Tax=Athalia rosae TaxID=37344 RepID=UPI0020336419|nr:frataxin homolog, mitochondrial [Athalia rosae]
MLSRIVLSIPVLRTVIKATPHITNRRFRGETKNFNRSRQFQNHFTRIIGTNRKDRKDILLELRSMKAYYSSETIGPYKPDLELNSVQFEKISNDTLESLTEYFDELVEGAAHLKDADVSYGDGVLTVKFGKQEGTYVINRQTPNKQIWLSSPKSGPKRYDFVDGKWIYKHDGKSLHDLLNKEIPAIIRNQALFEKCSYSGMEQYSDRAESNSIPD